MKATNSQTLADLLQSGERSFRGVTLTVGNCLLAEPARELTLDHVELSSGSLDSTRFIELSLISSSMENVAFNHCVFENCRAIRYQVKGCGFHAAHFRESDFSGGFFLESDLSGAVFENSDFAICEFAEVRFDKAVFINCNFNGAYFQEVSFEGVRFENTTFHGVMGLSREMMDSMKSRGASVTAVPLLRLKEWLWGQVTRQRPWPQRVLYVTGLIVLLVLAVPFIYAFIKEAWLSHANPLSGLFRYIWPFGR